MKIKIPKPKILKPGDQVRIIAPSSPFEKRVFRQGLGKLAAMGLSAVFSKDIFSKSKYLAGEDSRRLSEIHQAFKNRKTKAVFCARGGYGSTRLLDKMNFFLLKRNPKLFVGFSDITALHLAIYSKLKMPTIHGPMIASKRYVSQTAKYDSYFMQSLFSSSKFKYQFNKDVEVIRGGKAKGVILGGNLSIIHSLIGTEYLPNFKNKILLIEDIAEAPYKIDRILCHMSQAGILKGIRGIIVGKFTDLKGSNHKKDIKVIKEICEEYFKPMKIPFLFNVPVGHGPENIAIPLGVMALLDAGRKTLICEAAGHE